MVFFMMIPGHKRNSGTPRALQEDAKWRVLFGSSPGQAAGDDSAAIVAERRRMTSWAMATISRARTCLA
jgi:hypothetical protein